MRKLIGLVLCFAIVILASPNVMALTYGDYEYVITPGKTVKITAYLKDAETVNIPETINGMQVTSIGIEAFKQKKGIKNLTLPGTLTTIEEYAFWNCSSIKSIVIPASVKLIKHSSFAYCWGLEQIEFKGPVELIEKWTFLETPWLKEKFADYTNIENEDKIDFCFNGEVVVKKNNKYGITDLSANIILLCEYDEITPRYDDKYEVKKNGEWITLDRSFKPISKEPVSAEKYSTQPVLQTRVIQSQENLKSSLASSLSPRTAEAGIASSFLDSQGVLTVVYEGSDKLHVVTADSEFTIPMELPLFGAAITDTNGNIYILWGKEVAEDEKNVQNVIVSKHDGKTGNKITSCLFTAGNMSSKGTKVPFKSANADLAINGNIMAVHFGRTMFKSDDNLNHQSSTLIYVDIHNMTAVDMPIPYASHSFDQQVIPTKDGGFLLADRGDAYPRGFLISKVSGQSINSFEPFHFRESTSYNYTYSTLGGIAENAYGYSLVGVSDKTLSFTAIAPPNEERSEPKNLFIQVIKKNFFMHKNDKDKFVNVGVTRSPIGSAGEIGLKSNGTSYFLKNGTIDYNVIWLTDYSSSGDAVCPKVVAIDDKASAILWEYWNFGEYVSTYYTVVDYAGSIVVPATEIDARLCENRRPLFGNGKIYWHVSDKNEITVYELSVLS